MSLSTATPPKASTQASGLLDDFFSHTEFADGLKITPASLSASKSAGNIVIPEYKIGRKKYYKKSDVYDYLETLRKEPSGA